VRWLKWLTLALLAYVAVVFTLRIDWWLVVQQLVWPQLPFGREALLTIVAVFGTTISPYLFFWQAGQEMEDVNAGPKHADTPAQVRRHLRRIQWDTLVGMSFST